MVELIAAVSGAVFLREQVAVGPKDDLRPVRIYRWIHVIFKRGRISLYGIRYLREAAEFFPKEYLFIAIFIARSSGRVIAGRLKGYDLSDPADRGKSIGLHAPAFCVRDLPDAVPLIPKEDFRISVPISPHHVAVRVKCQSTTGRV